MSLERSLVASLRNADQHGKHNSVRFKDFEADITMPRASQAPYVLPRWLRRTLVHVVGTEDITQPKSGTGTHYLAILMRTLTYLSALVYSVTHAWIVLFGILTSHRSSIEGSASIIMVLSWCCMGIYSRSVAYRMLGHPNIRPRVQMVFRSIFRVNVMLSVIVLSVILLAADNYCVRTRMDNERSRQNGTTFEINVVREVAFATRILFSGFALLWNILVVFILMSACRSYTLGIRRFIRDLESDASTYDRCCSKKFVGAMASGAADYNIFSEYIWLDEDNPETTYATTPGKLEGQDGGKRGQCPSSAQKDKRLDLATISELTESIDSEVSCSDIIIEHHETYNSLPTNLGKTTFVSDCIARKHLSPHTCSSCVSESERGSFDAEANITMAQLHMLTLDQILHRHWKISCRLRLLSCALQRWMICFFGMCMGWIIDYLTYWLTHSPALLDVVQFVIPLILMPLIGSAYAEVNYEGKRMLKFVCPVEERFFMIDYLKNNPLQMVVYDFQVTYSTIVTAILGLLLALSSGIILQEMTS